ncbi:hypothetical protein THAOC_27065, partial [Thalassiosira oceanica]
LAEGRCRERNRAGQPSRSAPKMVSRSASDAAGSGGAQPGTPRASGAGAGAGTPPAGAATPAAAATPNQAPNVGVSLWRTCY